MKIFKLCLKNYISEVFIFLADVTFRNYKNRIKFAFWAGEIFEYSVRPIPKYC